MAEVVIYAVDAGSVPRGNFAWTSTRDRAAWSTSTDELAASAGADLKAGRRVALGVECVLFIPCPEDASRLGKARVGDCTPETGSKAFSANAAACATMTGLPSLSWILRAIHRSAPEIRGTTRWDEFMAGKASLLLWEAFVSGKEKAVPPSHQGDALLALEAFEHAVRSGAPASRVTCEGPLSLAGAALLWAGMSDDLTLLQHAALVLRPVPKAQRLDPHGRAIGS